VWAELLDLVFPPRCVSCGARGAWLCAACQGKIKRQPGTRCERCDRLATQSPCPACTWMHPALVGIRIVGDYEPPLKDAIWALKFKGRQQVARPLGGMLATTWHERGGAPMMAVVPVPPASDRRRRRGYDPAELLAQQCARQFRLPLWRDVLQRTRQAPPQRGLDAPARRSNADGLFACSASTTHRLAGQRLLVVDDVTTTGATLDAIATALAAAGAAQVWGLALARPLLHVGHI
jgi:ComF family protein